MSDLRTPITDAIAAIADAVQDFHDALGDLNTAVGDVRALAGTTGQTFPKLLAPGDFEKDLAALLVGGNGDSVQQFGGSRFPGPAAGAITAFSSRWTTNVAASGVPNS